MRPDFTVHLRLPIVPSTGVASLPETLLCSVPKDFIHNASYESIANRALELRQFSMKHRIPGPRGFRGRPEDALPVSVSK